MKTIVKTIAQQGIVKYSVLLSLLVFASYSPVYSAAVTSLTTGNWSATAWPNTTRTGTITTSLASATVTGTGTSFTTQISVGNIIKTGANVVIGTVLSITNNTTLIFTANAASANSGIAFNSQGVGPVDAITIASGSALTVDGNFSCTSLAFPAVTANTTLAMSGTNTLTVTAAVTMALPAASMTSTIAVGNGSLSCVTLTMNATTAGRNNIISIGTGIVTISGATSTGTTGCQFNFSGAGTLTFGGTFSGPPSFTTVSGSTVRYSRAGVQTVAPGTYSNLILAGTSAKTLAATVTINDKLTLQGTATCAGSAPTWNTAILEYNGTALQTPSTVEFPATFTQSVIINNSVGVTVSTAKTINGNFTISAGTFTMGGALTVDGNLTLSTGATLDCNNFDINLKGNWVQTGVLFFGTRTINFNGTSNQIISGSGPTFYHITVANTAGVTMQTGAFINGNLNLSGGCLDIGTSSIVLAATSSILNAAPTRYIKIYDSPTTGGTIAMSFTGSRLFPVGTTTYTPVTINNLGAADYFFVSICNGVFADGTGGSLVSRRVDRTWMVSKATGGVANVTLTMQWNAGEEVGSFSRTSCGVFHYTGGSWDDPTSYAAASGTGPYTTTRSGISSFSPFAVGDGMVPLPVELLSFSAKTIKNVVNLNWATATEINNSHFEIQRSVDGQEFAVIDRVEGAGNSNSILNYEFSDENALTANISYYRLKQVDFDGSVEYSNILTVQPQIRSIFAADIYPMPVMEMINLPLQNTENGNCIIDIYDMSGNLVYSKSHTLFSGSQIISLPTDGLSQGIYLLNLRKSAESYSIRLVK